MSKKKPPKPTREKSLLQILLEDLEMIESRFYRGDRIELFHAIVRCRQYGLPLPAWVSDEIEKGYRRYINAEARTLDEAFDVTRPIGFHLGAEQDRVTKAFKVYKHIQKERENGASLTNEFYELVGQDFGVSGSTARRYYGKVKKVLTPRKTNAQNN